MEVGFLWILGGTGEIGEVGVPRDFGFLSGRRAMGEIREIGRGGFPFGSCLL